jgi:hypothetical protein
MKHWAQNGFKALTSACVLALLATVAWSQSITWLGTLTPTGGSSYALGVSNDGLTVVGAANGNAVVWDRAANTIITVYNGSSSMSRCDATGAIAVGFGQSWLLWLIQNPVYVDSAVGLSVAAPVPRTSAGAPTSPRRAQYAAG